MPGHKKKKKKNWQKNTKDCLKTLITHPEQAWGDSWKKKTFLTGFKKKKKTIQQNQAQEGHLARP